MTGSNLASRSSSARLGSTGAVVASAGLLVNALGYLTPVLGARQLSASGLSELATALAVLAIASVPGLGLQTVLAVRTARHGSVPGAARATLVTALVTGGALAVATPGAAALLRLPAVLLLLVAASTVATVLAGRWLGDLQGNERFGALAVGMVLLAVGRYGGIIAGLVLGTSAVGATALGVAGAWLVLPLFALLAHRRNASGAAATPPALGRSLGRGITSASGATIAMLAVSYADLVLARHFLAPAESGAYAVGAVLTKGALWAPQVVTVLALPRLAQGSRRALLVSVGLIAGCGAALVGAAAVAGGLAVQLAGGAAYASLTSYAAGFAAVGALYALVFVLVNAEIAAGVRWPAAVLWVALAAMTGAATILDIDSVSSMLTLSLVTAGSTAVVMGVLAQRRVSRGPVSG